MQVDETNTYRKLGVASAIKRVRGAEAEDGDRGEKGEKEGERNHWKIDGERKIESETWTDKEDKEER